MSSSFASFPACGKPYKPFCIRMYTKPLFTRGSKLYSEMISCGMMAIGKRVYSGDGRLLFR